MLKYLIEKEFKQFVRNEFLPRLVIILPCIVMLILPWAADLEIKNVNVSIVDNDHSAYSTQLVDKILASKYFTLKNASSTYSQAIESVEKGDSDIILEIPYGFESDFIRENISKLLISVNTVNGTKGLIGSSYLSMVVKDFAEKLLDEKGILPAQPATMNIPVIEVATKTLFNPQMEYKVFMVPALMVMLLTLISGFFPAVNIVTEKEKGTIEQLNVSPVRKIVFIFAKLIPYWIIGFVVLTVCFAIAYLMYGLFPAGSFVTLYLISLIYIFAVSGLGLVISNYSDTLQQSMFMMFFFLIVFVLMSGLFTPIRSMPQWAQNITLFNPLRYFIQAMRNIYMKGSDFSEIAM
ncbi:MAG: ABC transporter permease, partial [Prevotellaceae bacterium]|nr:ABC transporter permease [Prevotellaceae bacterium]